jgi:hypothetical protein
MTGLRRRLAALVLALPMAACSVTAGEVSPNELAVNRCEHDTDCIGGGCLDGICGGAQGELTSVLVSVTPSAADARLASLTFYVPYPGNGKLLPASGQPDVGINLGESVQLSGSVRAEDDDDRCKQRSFIPRDGLTIMTETYLVPADLTFTPSVRLLGLPSDSYRATIAPNGYTFGLSVPPGEYDVYIQPYRQPVEADGRTLCPVPPRLLLRQTVGTNLEFKLAEGATLPVKLVWPAGTDLTRWTLDLVDPDGGRSLAIPRVIRAEDLVSTENGTSTYVTKLDYAPMYAPNAKGALQPLSIGTTVLTLTPPADPTLVAPTFMAQLSGTQLGDDPADIPPAVLEQKTALPAPVHVEFLTDREQDGEAVGAVITLTATELEGVEDLFMSFTRTVSVGKSLAMGGVDLLPGKYRVVAVPTDPCDATACLASTETTWIVSSKQPTQAGKLISFSELVTLSGRAQVPSGEGATGATVRALASSSVVDWNIMNRADGQAAVLPRARFGFVDPGGTFAFGTDPGVFDLRVEPDPATGFGWSVKPRFAVDGSESVADVGRLALALPIVYTGSVTTGVDANQTALPSALIRAYVYLSSDGKVLPQPAEGSVAVQVAETHSDVNGAFKLLLPPRLDLN